MEMLTIFREFAQAAGPVVVTALWQGLALAGGLALCLRFAPRVDAADRFRALAAGFFALTILPLMPLLNVLRPGAHGSPSLAAPAAHAWLDVDPRWALAIGAIWIAASVWRAADLAVHGFWLRKLWKDAEPIELADAEVTVFATRLLDRPSVIGFFRPRVLIPAWLLGRLSHAELEQVLLHESEHLRRRDDWTNLLQKLALVVFPLNPALVWLERELCREREMACDDAVVRATGKPRAYAACLASIAERGLERRREALQLGAWRKRPELVGRVHRILKHAPGLNPVAARALLVVVGGGLVFGSVEFARAPQLVAFVAASPRVIAESNTPDLLNVDGRPMAGYRAMPTVAHLPSRANELPSAKIAVKAEKHVIAAASGANQSATLDADKATPQSPVAEAVNVTPAASVHPQWIVLTTWQQVTVRRRAGAVADYDIDQNAAQDAEQAAVGAAAGAAHSLPALGQWTVTQLILRVPDANTAQGQAQNERNSLTTQPTSAPVPPAAVLMRDGWLVLQL